MYKWYAPQYWPKTGGGVSFTAKSDEVLDLREFAFGSGVAISSGGASGGGSGFDWLGSAEEVAGAVFGGAGSDDESGGDWMLKSFGDTDDSDGGSLLSDAQSFEYQPEVPDGDAHVRS